MNPADRAAELALKNGTAEWRYCHCCHMPHLHYKERRGKWTIYRCSNCEHREDKQE